MEPVSVDHPPLTASSLLHKEATSENFLLAPGDSLLSALRSLSMLGEPSSQIGKCVTLVTLVCTRGSEGTGEPGLDQRAKP